MKPFNLEEYLKNPNKKVVTRNGLPVRIICTDRKDEYSIVALVKEKTGIEVLFSYNTQGGFWPDKCFDFDLMFVTTKKEGWVNVYKYSCGEHSCACIYSTRKEAIDQGSTSYAYVTTTKIEWEE